MPLDALVASARARAMAEKRPVLVSSTERVAALDPLLLLETLVRDSKFNGLAEHVAAGMMYWGCPSDDFALAGIGAVATLTATGTERFASIDREWAALLDRALIGDEDGNIHAPGPVLMGGFAFENDGPHTQPWRNFPGAHLIVPRLQLTSVAGQVWATTSVIVGPDGEPDMDVDAVSDLLRHVRESNTSASNGSAKTDHAPEMPEFSDCLPASQWRDLVSKAVDDIRAGVFHKVVLARAVQASASRDMNVFSLLRHLRAAHRSSFVFGYWRGDSAFVGASPERLVRLDGRDVRASSLAGTARRGATPAEDAELAALLMASGKDQAEHAAVRDSLRSRLEEVCDDVIAHDTPALLTLPHVHHLHTAVSGKLRSDYSLLDLVGRLHPTPAVGGTPRKEALEFIRDNEQLDRGWYAAPIGWVARDSGEFAVGLRSGVIAGNEAILFAGCGIVADSDPDLELAESVLKLQPMQSAISTALAPRASNSATAAASEQIQ